MGDGSQPQAPPGAPGAAVGPPRSEALLGQVLLEVLDLVVDCPGKRVFPNPSSPIYPSLKLK